jgi:hypothetical protein
MTAVVYAGRLLDDILPPGMVAIRLPLSKSMVTCHPDISSSPGHLLRHLHPVNRLHREIHAIEFLPARADFTVAQAEGLMFTRREKQKADLDDDMTSGLRLRVGERPPVE